MLRGQQRGRLGRAGLPLDPPIRGEERGRAWGLDRPGPRRFHLFAVGLPKSGSTSIAELFQGWRSGHEHQFEATAELLATRPDRATLRAFLAARDAAGLEMDAATFHHLYVDTLVELFPAARFVLAVREPRAWLASWLGMMARNRRRYGDGPVPGWQARFGRVLWAGHDPEVYRSEASLRAALPALTEAWLAHWVERHRVVLAAVPPERLLLLPTAALSRSLGRLAAWAGVPEGSLVAAAHHQNRAPEAFRLLEGLPPDPLDAAVAAARAALPSLATLLAPQSLDDAAGAGGVASRPS